MTDQLHLETIQPKLRPMRLLLDNQEISLDRPSLAAAIAAGVAAAESQGRIIVEASLDGTSLDDDSLSSPSDKTMESGEVRLVSAEPRSLVRVTLLDAADALDEALKSQNICAEAIQTGQVQDALEPLRDALGIWDTIREVVVKSAKLMAIELDQIQDPGAEGEQGATITHLTDALGEHLGEVKRCLGVQDWAALADVLAYDLADEVARWKRLLQMMAGSIQAET